MQTSNSATMKHAWYGFSWTNKLLEKFLRQENDITYSIPRLSVSLSISPAWNYYLFELTDKQANVYTKD